MIKILFVCHGNICRSPMAEYLMKDMVKKHGREDDFYIESAATSTEEIGARVHTGTAAILDSLQIDYSDKKARQMTRSDYDRFDYIIGMDTWNIKNMLRITGGDLKGKIHKLMDYTLRPGDVADPWYTGNFKTTYGDISEGIKELYKAVTDN